MDVYIGYLARGKKYATEVLAPGGLRASKGITITAKLKKFFFTRVCWNILRNGDKAVCKLFIRTFIHDSMAEFSSVIDDILSTIPHEPQNKPRMRILLDLYHEYFEAEKEEEEIQLDE